MKRRCIAMLAIAALIGLCITGAVSWGQGGADPGTLPQPVRLLLVDETKTFASTMRVGALAKVVRGTQMFDLSVRLVDVVSSYADPLEVETIEEGTSPFQIILIVPRGIDDGSVNQIWLVTRSFEEIALPVRAAIGALSTIVDQVFQGVAESIDVSEDLWPALAAALYCSQGWLQ